MYLIQVLFAVCCRQNAAVQAVQFSTACLSDYDVHRECVKAGQTRTAVVAVQGRPLLSASELTSGEWGGWTLLLEAVCSRDMTCERLPVAGGLVSIVRRPNS